MNNGLIVTAELTTATVASTALSTAVSAEPLLTALITFGVSLVTIAGSELIKFLVAFLKNKTKKYEDSDTKDTKE